jgi:pentapeptide MXKDX repeat protein
MNLSIRNAVFGLTVALAGFAATPTFAEDAKSADPMQQDAMSSGAMATQPK